MSGIWRTVWGKVSQAHSLCWALQFPKLLQRHRVANMNGWEMESSASWVLHTHRLFLGCLVINWYQLGGFRGPLFHSKYNRFNLALWKKRQRTAPVPFMNLPHKEDSWHVKAFPFLPFVQFKVYEDKSVKAESVTSRATGFTSRR